MKQTIYIGADHAGFAMKEALKTLLEQKGYHVEDLGAQKLDPADDYPQYAANIAHAVASHKGSLGILSCGNAEGVCIAANKFDSIRAGVGFSNKAAQTMRADDDANVICIPGRIKTLDDPFDIVLTFLRTPFSQEIRHKRRLAKIARFEHPQIEIVPAVLESTKQDLIKRLSYKPLKAIAPIWQIDILNGSLFDKQSFANPAEIKHIPNLPGIELHIMAEDPIDIIEQWKYHVQQLKRVIIHAEIKQPLEPILTYIKKLGLESGIALSPSTPITALSSIAYLLDSILIMGVEPGSSGQSFLGRSILKKIKKAKKLYPNISIAVDGGINVKTGKKAAKAGASRLAIGSAIWQSPDPEKAFEKLSTSLL